MQKTTIEQLAHLQAIRETIRRLHNEPGKSKMDKPLKLKQEPSLSTPEKQMEHQVSLSLLDLSL